MTNKKGRPNKKKSNGLFTTITCNYDYICSNCGSDTTYIRIRNGIRYPAWYNYNGGKICHKCHNILVVNIKYKNRTKPKQFHLTFNNLRITLSFELSRDKCEICGILKGQGKRIDRHHYFYCIIMPWACTIPVCNPCHQKIGHMGKKYNKKRKNLLLTDF